MWNQNYACFLVTYLEVTVPITWSKPYNETLTLEKNQHLAHLTMNNLDSFLTKHTSSCCKKRMYQIYKTV